MIFIYMCDILILPLFFYNDNFILLIYITLLILYFCTLVSLTTMVIVFHLYITNIYSHFLFNIILYKNIKFIKIPEII